MLTDQFFKYIKGYIIIHAQGILQEELIKKCFDNHIVLKNIKLEETGFTAQACADDYIKIARFAKNLGMKTKVIKKYGFDFWKFNHRKRYGLFIGIFIFFYMIYFLSGRLWNIDIKGTNLISDEVILKKLYDNGVYIGMKINNPQFIDVVNLERTLLCDIPDISCIVLNFKGTNLEVIINEIHHKKFIIDNETEKNNIIASEPGIITNIKVTNGTSEVKIGQTVVKGQLLISGITEGKTGMLHFKNASGEIKAIIEDTIEMQIDFDQEDYVESNEYYIINFIIIANKKIQFTFE